MDLIILNKKSPFFSLPLELVKVALIKYNKLFCEAGCTSCKNDIKFLFFNNGWEEIVPFFKVPCFWLLFVWNAIIHCAFWFKQCSLAMLFAYVTINMIKSNKKQTHEWNLNHKYFVLINQLKRSILRYSYWAIPKNYQNIRALPFNEKPLYI